jgi:hypothetical protein
MYGNEIARDALEAVAKSSGSFASRPQSCGRRAASSSPRLQQHVARAGSLALR